MRYTLDGSSQPIAVTSFTLQDEGYTYEALPAKEKAVLPSPEAITTALGQGTVVAPEGD